MSGKFYTNKHNLRAKRVFVTAQYAGVKLEVVAFNAEEKNAEFVAKFPLGKVPAFEAADGTHLFDADAIARFVAGENRTLTGETTVAAAQVQQFIGFANNDLFPAVCTWVFPIYGAIPYNKTAVDAAKADLTHSLGALNTILRTRTYLVGERVSLADITVASVLIPLFEHAADAAVRAQFPNLTRWLTTLINQKQFLAVFGKVQFTATEKQAGAAAAAVADKPKEEKKKEAAPAAEKPKEEKKKPAKKDDDEEDEPIDEEEKESNKPEFQFTLLPKSSFDLDGFKRSYSNEDTATKAIPHFWEHLDREGYSIWRCDYKYPEELKKCFMTANLISGFFQRIEKLRKFAFGSMCIFGTDDNNQISGVWVTRGQDQIFSRADDWNVDAPSYNWKKLDVNNAADKKMVDEYLLWEGDEFKERSFNQGKIFK
ncbi:eukaryotic translation elongation factor 1 gamma [Capsaspora owczarzaki ATCC 30864]|uniref:Eukaryotic translation elongation factor 1 gamma n=1 Tax=Capsaspora owczarzaki (strain ATCC 30864) TaxID=595528 RepID=A0A0D2U9Y3_CAPO3|nr:eukaryotic translation elongation factor 1 gamma [Capsaspora owczarzaki ATCC 30864]KJE91871.1 eukaryotic translation elongation factor 1 gamma [Capsaspora owczarzaki ATCC 30864]|eukprot:XP_004363777.1 eukaryotic translation elongation factor 1 gamma [Capsaspora owczarzaki ATCC 30864]